MNTALFCQRWMRATTAIILPASVAVAAPLDESKLPPPANKEVDFARDVQPIFERSCLRCHGPEKPKSHFQLTDRVSALKGGSTGVDIIPGQSGKSPLIHYVARVVPDMEMPPTGRAEPLSTNEVALLRAWIDQGAVWGTASAAASNVTTIAIAPTLSWVGVSGDQNKFRELEWQPEGWNGGAEEFQLQQRFRDGRSVLLEGHALRDDYSVTLDLRKPDLGFTRFGFEQFRKYFDDSGGYYPGFTPSQFSLGRDLFLDVGRAWAEVGLTLPEWPRLVVGYEYQYREGDKSMLTWGSVMPPNGNFLDIRNIYPSAKHIDEEVHVVRLDVSYDLQGFLLEDNLRAEFLDLKTERTDALNVPAGLFAPDYVTQVAEGQNNVQVANVFHVEKQVTRWWLLGAGYLFSSVDGDATFHLQPENDKGQPAAGSTWNSNDILLKRASDVVNFSSQFLPLPHLTGAVGVQGDWSHEEDFGDLELDEVSDPNDPTTGILQQHVLAQSDIDKAGAEENVALRYSGIPFTALFADARLKQEEWSIFKEADGGFHSFLIDTDASSRWQEYRAGLSVSPWRPVNLAGHYKHRDRTIDYDYARDEFPLGFSPGPGYPGFILARDIGTDETELRLTLHPATWLKTAFTYQWITTDYRTTTEGVSTTDAGPDATPGGQVAAGDYDAQVFSVNATATPFHRLFLSAMLSYLNSDITTAANGSPAVAPYRGDTYTVIASLGYALSEKTRLLANYAFSQANYGQNNYAGGLPLGLDYTRHGIQAGIARTFGKYITARLQYGYFSYDEPSSGHYNDYTAHQVLAVLSIRWP